MAKGMGEVSDLKALITSIGVLISLAFVDVIGIIVILAFKGVAADTLINENCTLNPDCGSLTVNTTADAFVAAIVIVSSFIGLIILAVMAKVVIRVMRQ